MKDISISMICDVTEPLQINVLKFRHTHKQSKWLPFIYMYILYFIHIFYNIYVYFVCIFTIYTIFLHIFYIYIYYVYTIFLFLRYNEKSPTGDLKHVSS